MEHAVTIAHLSPRYLAAVRRTAAPGEVPTVWKPALDLVWAFLGHHPDLRTDGHNVFLYEHGAGPTSAMHVEFGVEVSQPFEGAGEIHYVETPVGQAAVVVHRGDYSGLPAAHTALHAWCAANGHAIGTHSLEIYGDWAVDPAEREVTIQYLLR